MIIYIKTVALPNPSVPSTNIFLKNHHQLPPPPPPKPPPEEPPPPEELLEGALTIVALADAMVPAKELEKWFMEKELPPGPLYQLGGGTFKAANFLAHPEKAPKASA